MGSVYYMRHGQTVWNVAHKVAGVTDVPLTEEGRRQAQAAAEELLREEILPDEIWCSPLARARDTAGILSEHTGLPVRIEPRLIEQNFGRWEGCSTSDEGFIRDKQSFTCRFQSGESMLQVAQRVYGVLDELRSEPDRTRLLVAHNGIARVVFTYFREMSNEEFARWSVPNCRLIRFDFT